MARLLETKSSRARRVTLGPSAARCLEQHRARQQSARDIAGGDWDDRWDLVFARPNGRYVHPDSFSSHHSRVMRTSDVPAIRFHDLRHTHASLLLQLGVPIKTISERLGHASVTTTMDTYAHLLPAMDRDAADTFAKILRGGEG